MFLDTVAPLVPPPIPVTEPGTDVPETLAVQLDALHRACVDDPVRASTYTRRFHEAEKVLSEIAARQPSTPARISALWGLSECYRLTGQLRHSEAAFDEYLTDLPEFYQGQALSDAYERTIQLYTSGADRGWPEHVALVRQMIYPPGEHRSQRAWDAYIDALQREHADAPGRLQQALRRIMEEHDTRLAAYGKLRAFALLEHNCPDVAARWEMLAVASRAAEHQRDDRQALDLLQKAMAAGPSAGNLPIMLSRLLGLQAANGAPLEEARETYDQLKAYESDRRFTNLVKLGLYDLAQAGYQAGAYAEALQLLQQYDARYGNDARSTSLAARCAERVKE
ncbi:MAG TPA: hypothetical protein DGT21_06770 [Armatimonadetes bacterium]|nr:hypothetical protein [Armatimonadota bacterium]